MTNRRSYLDTLNAGRERRPDPSYADLNRALDSLESTFDSLAGRRTVGDHPAPRGASDRNWGTPAHQSERRDRDDWLDSRNDRLTARPVSSGRADYASLARDIDHARGQEDNLAAISRIATDLTSLKRDLRAEVSTALGEQFEILRRDIETLYKTASHGRADPEVAYELQRISDAIRRMAERPDSHTLNALLGEMDVLKQAVGDLAREETLRTMNRRWDEFGERFDSVERHLAELPRAGETGIHDIDRRLAQIVDVVSQLPDTLPIRTLEDKVRTLAGAIDHFSRNQDSKSPRSIEAIEHRLDEISRALVATSVSIQSAQYNPEPFERIEARISSLARQIDDFGAAKGDTHSPQAFAELSERLDLLTERADLPRRAVERLTDQITKIAEMLDASALANHDAETVRTFERRFEVLADSLQRNQEDALRESAGHARALEQRLEAVIDRLDAPAPVDDSMRQAFEARFADLSHRLADVGQGINPSAMRSLEARLDDIAFRLDHAREPAQSVDPDLVRNLETQVAALSTLLSRPEKAASVPDDLAIRLDRLEDAVLTNRDTILDAARIAAEEAIRIAPGNPNGPAILALADDLKTLDTLARRSDERNAKTFDAIHETLLKIVDRLVMLENTKPAHAAAAAAPAKIAVDPSPSLAHEPQAADLGVPAGPAEAFREKSRAVRTGRSPAEAATEAAFAAIEGEARNAETTVKPKKKSLLGGIAQALGKARKTAPAVAVPENQPADVASDVPAGADEIDPALANKPLEPGSGTPDLNAIMRRVREERKAAGGANSSDAAGQSDFVAAARRAAQAAAAEAETLKKRSENTGRKSGGLAETLKLRRKPILMAIGAIIIALSGLQLGKQLLSDKPATQVAAPASKPEAGAVAPKTAEANPVAATSTPAAEQKATAPTTPAPEVRTVVPASPGAPTKPQAAETAKVETPAASAVEASTPAPATENPEATPVVTITDPQADAGPAALIEAVRNGNAKAMFELGSRYADGRSGKTDLKSAANWYEEAAKLGLAPAQYRIGNLYEKGTGVERDLTKAKTWYQMAAEQGNASAMHNLAVLFASGTESAAANESSARWFLAAAELGVKDSQYNLGILSAKGIGLPQNLEESYKWFALASKGGDKDAAAKRDEVAKALRPEQLEKARATTEMWQPKPIDPATNSVDIPAEWGDGDARTASVDMKKAIKNIQLILNKNGYDAGSPDGVMGEKTKTAITAYQQANGMAATGEVDEALVRSLLTKK